MKRVFDLIISLTLMLLLSPFLMITIILLLFSSGLPIFYIQERVGLNSKLFRIYKFRTMTVNNENKGEVLVNNPYVTPFGNILRRFKIDELPQLLNIVKGDMSLVGPRPLTKEIVEGLESHKRLNVKPGVTGLAQVNGNIYLSREERIQLDENYVDNNSLLVDLKILTKTILVVCFGEKKFVK